MTERITLYVTSDGRYLTEWQLRRRTADGGWTRHIVDRSTGTVLVETSAGSVIGLTRLPGAERPDWLEIRSDGTGVWVADRRRTLPPSSSDGCVLEKPTSALVEAFVAPRRP